MEGAAEGPTFRRTDAAAVAPAVVAAEVVGVVVVVEWA